MAAAANNPPVHASASGTSDIFGKFSSKLSDTLQNAGVRDGLDSFISGVKNILISKKNMQITRAVDCFMEGSTAVEFEDYLYLDPKVSSRGAGAKVQKGAVHNDAIVFVVGGGNFLEHQNLVDYAQVGAWVYNCRIRR
jgi:hypothetical protein